MKIPEFKIRCSAIGKIMGYPDKNILQKGAQTYCRDWLKGQLLNRKADTSSKFTEKGNIMEDAGIDMVAKHLGYAFLVKNEEHFENDFIKGTPDVLPVNKSLVIDVKNSWSFETFPLLEDEETNKDYYWQGLGYMALTQRDSFILAYTLTDTPMHLIERTARVWCYNNGYDFDNEIFERFRNQLIYSDIPKELRIKLFHYAFDPNAIELVYKRVLLCRDYISDLIKKNEIF